MNRNEEWYPASLLAWNPVRVRSSHFRALTYDREVSAVRALQVMGKAMLPRKFKAGETVTVYIYPAATDFTLVDTVGVRGVVPGDYTVRFGVRETEAHGMGFAEHTITAH